MSDPGNSDKVDNPAEPSAGSSERSVHSDLAQVGQDVEHLAEDFAHLVEDTAAAAQRVSDDLVGAEFVASREVVDDLSLWFDFWDRLGALQRRQFETLVNDYRETAERMSGPEPALTVLGDHLRRRVDSCVTGAKALQALAGEEMRRAQSAHDELWRPYLAILGTDLTGRPSRRV